MDTWYLYSMWKHNKFYIHYGFVTKKNTEISRHEVQMETGDTMIIELINEIEKSKKEKDQVITGYLLNQNPKPLCNTVVKWDGIQRDTIRKVTPKIFQVDNQCKITLFLFLSTSRSYNDILFEIIKLRQLWSWYYYF